MALSDTSSQARAASDSLNMALSDTSSQARAASDSPNWSGGNYSTASPPPVKNTLCDVSM